MTDDERRKRIQEILDKDDEAAAALAEARELSITIGAVHRVDTSVGTSIDGLRIVLNGVAAANEHNLVVSERAIAVNAAIGRVVTAAREANRLTMALLDDM